MTKSIPGLLAFAVTSSLLFAQGDNKQAAAGGGWTAKPGSGLTYDGGDAFSVKWVNRLQVHWVYSANEDIPDTNTFLIRRLRTSFTGHVFSKDILYNLTLDGVDSGATGDGAVKYAWGMWNFSKKEDGELGLRAGQDKSPFGLEAMWSSGGLWFVERSTPARAFADSFSRGAWLRGRAMGKDLPVRYSVGVQNTDVANGLGAGYTDRGEEANNSDNELSYVLSANIDPCGDFHDGKQTVDRRQGDWRTDDTSLKGTVGIGVCLGNGKDTGTGNDVESTSININTAWNVSRFNILAEFFSREDDLQGGAADKEKPTGFSASVGYLMEKSADSKIQWGFGLRYAMLSTDNGDNAAVNYLNPTVISTGGANVAVPVEADVSEISLVANAFYHGHSCKTQLEWTIQDVEPTGGSSSTNNVFRIAFQVEF
jgi:hypothetical protein